MTKQLDKENKMEETFSSHLKQRHQDLNKLKEEINQNKEYVSSLRSHLEEVNRHAKGVEKVMEDLALLEGQVDEEEKDEEIFKLKLDITSLKAEACEATRLNEEMETILPNKDDE